MTIGFKKLALQARIGVNDQEKLATQTLFVSVKLNYPPVNVAWFNHHDAMEKAFDYSELASKLKVLFLESHHDVLEHLLHKSLALILKLFPDSTKIHLSISKPKAISDAEAAFSSLKWSRDSL